MSSITYHVTISRIFGDVLYCLSSAKMLRDDFLIPALNSHVIEKIVVDFKGVERITRIFVQQALGSIHSYEIQLINIKDEYQSLFDTICSVPEVSSFESTSWSIVKDRYQNRFNRDEVDDIIKRTALYCNRILRGQALAMEHEYPIGVSYNKEDVIQMICDLQEDISTSFGLKLEAI